MRKALTAAVTTAAAAVGVIGCGIPAAHATSIGTAESLHQGGCRSGVIQTSIWPWSPHYLYGHSHTVVTVEDTAVTTIRVTSDAPRSDITPRNVARLVTATGITVHTLHLGTRATTHGRWYLRRGDRIVVTATFDRYHYSDTHCGYAIRVRLSEPVEPRR